jgi:hypothetical protein
MEQCAFLVITGCSSWKSILPSAPYPYLLKKYQVTCPVHGVPSVSHGGNGFLYFLYIKEMTGRDPLLDPAGQRMLWVRRLEPQIA